MWQLAGALTTAGSDAPEPGGPTEWHTEHPDLG